MAGKKLEWDKEGRERRARQHGRTPAGVSTSGRAVYASDELVKQLKERGYASRKRPESAAQARHLLSLFKKLGVSHTTIEQAQKLSGTARKERVAELLERLEQGYQQARSRAEGSELGHLDHGYVLLRARIRKLQQPPGAKTK